MNFNREEVAWAAGFFDGEGCVQVYERVVKGYTILEMRLTVFNRDLRPIKRLREIFGGTIQSSVRAGAEGWVWRICGKDSTEAAKAMLFHTSAKFEQLELFIEAREITDSRNQGTGSHSEQDKVRRSEIAQEIKMCKSKVNASVVLP